MMNTHLKKKAARFFSRDMNRQLQEKLEGPDCDPYTTSFDEICIEVALSLLGEKKLTFPSTQPLLAHLIPAVRCIMSDDIFALWLPRIVGFDDLVGSPGLADAFCQNQSLDSWISSVVGHMLFVWDIKALSKVSKPFKTRPTIFHQLDGNEDPKMLRQIVLRGPNILEALKANSTLTSLTYPPRNWTPEGLEGFNFYHGTTSRNKPQRFLDTLMDQGPSALSSWYSAKNQVSPPPCVHTSFNAVRPLLWSVFEGQVIDPPTPSSHSKLNAEWSAGDEMFRGVILMVFNSSQPTPTTLTSFTIPDGVESSWATRAATNFWPQSYGDSREGCWRDFKSFHSPPEKPSTLPEWPDLVHGLELENVRECIRSYNNGSFYRTAWCSESAMTQLNKSYDRAYAITFEFEADKTTSLASSNDKKFSGSIWKRVGTLGKGVRSGLKNLFCLGD